MNVKNVNFGEDKLRIKIVDKKSFTGQGGTVSVLYEDISSLSVVKNPTKLSMILIGLISLGVSIFFIMQGVTAGIPILAGVGLVSVILGIIMPKEFLGVETRGGSQYLANVPGSEIFDVIDEIEKRRKFKK